MVAEQEASCQIAATRHILVVDDDENIGRVFQKGFRYQGAAIVYFSSALKALEWTAEVTPVLAIVDVMMPEMGGLELCQALRNRDNTRDLPIVLLSGVDRRELEGIASMVEAVAFVSKPFSPRQMFALIRSQLETRR